MSSLKVQRIKQDQSAICDKLLRSLPDWFGIESAIQHYAADAAAMTCFAAFDEEKAVGILALNFHNEFTAEIHVIAVHPDYHRRGIGKALFATAEEEAKAKSCEFLSVKTLSPSKPDKYYDTTRKFYLAAGFRPLEEIKSIWGEANPCLLMVKALALRHDLDLEDGYRAMSLDGEREAEAKLFEEAGVADVAKFMAAEDDR